MPATNRTDAPGPVKPPVQRDALDHIARRLGAADANAFPWGDLRYQNVVELRRWLARTYKPSTANRYLNAIKAALKETWRAKARHGAELRRILSLRRIDKGQLSDLGSGFASTGRAKPEKAPPSNLVRLIGSSIRQTRSP